MKKILFLLAAAAFALTAAEPAGAAKTAAVPVKKQPAPKVVRKKIDYFPNLKRPALENPQSWTMVVVPDIQGYVSKSTNHGILNMMLSWIAAQKQNLNIKQVLFTGDLVDQNCDGKVIPNRYELVCEEQWETTSKLLTKLDGKLPYILCTGNHDYGVRAAENRRTLYNDYFKSNRNPLTREQLIECGFNFSGIKTMENAVFEFTAPYPDCRKFLVATVQFAPKKEQLEWFRNIFNDPKYADHFGIVLTHAYMRTNGEYIKKHPKYEPNLDGGLAGEDIHELLIKQTKNIRLVVCGHVAGTEDWVKSVGFHETVNAAGKKVAQMIFNTQAIGKGIRYNGGDGWLRLLEFMPDKKTIKARTFSPLFAASPSTCHLAWKTDARNEFTFTIE